MWVLELEDILILLPAGTCPGLQQGGGQDRYLLTIYQIVGYRIHPCSLNGRRHTACGVVPTGARRARPPGRRIKGARGEDFCPPAKISVPRRRLLSPVEDKHPVHDRAARLLLLTAIALRDGERPVTAPIWNSPRPPGAAGGRTNYSTPWNCARGRHDCSRPRHHRGLVMDSYHGCSPGVARRSEAPSIPLEPAR